MLHEEDKALAPLMRVVHSTGGAKGAAHARMNYVLLRIISAMIPNLACPQASSRFLL